jgi:hypothetical protein
LGLRKSWEEKMRLLKGTLRWPVLAAFLVATASTTVHAQTLERAEIRGTVYDPTKAVIPSAQLTLTNPATGFERSTKANQEGVYTFAQIPTGTYRIVAEFAGFSPTTITDIRVNVGASLSLDIVLQLAGQAETVTVAAESGLVDTSTAGISQLINAEAVENLPLSGRDYRDLAQLSPTAQVVPGLRGGIRLGGQQSDYAGLVIDGGDAYDNTFGEFFGSLETKNFTIPLDAVQEFQVVTNGFAPEFGRSTGGLLNVVTKSGTNQLQGTGHYYYRDDALTSDDALGTPPNIDRQQQFGGAAGFPLQRDKQFLFLAVDRQLQHGPLVTRFSRNVQGVAVPELGISNLADLEGPHEQFQNLFSILGRYDIQIASNHQFNVRSFFTRNHTDGFTGGRGQNEIQASFGNSELFTNQGVNTVGSLSSVLGNKLNEVKVMYSYQTRPRFPNDDSTEVQINDTGTFGGRFFLPINGDLEKLQIQDNFVYAFGKHDMKFGGDINAYAAVGGGFFIGWSRGSYFFNTLEDFRARQPFGFIQGFGLNGVPYQEAATNPDRSRQTGIGLYVQDKWQVTPSLSVTYGLRWDGTNNPRAISATPGQRVYAGAGSDSRLVMPPQEAPDDYAQWGPRVGVSYRLPWTAPTIIRGAWGLYYAQIPTIFVPTGSGRTTALFCFFPGCLPPGGFASLYPDPLNPGDPATAFLGPPGITYVDPDFRNPRVSNFSTGIEHQFASNWTASVNYAYAHSDRLRVGGFSTTQWERNVVVDHVDEFGRSILRPSPVFGPLREDSTIGSANALASLGRGNYHQLAFNVTRRFSGGYQLFANYAWSRNRDSASSERDSETFFGPQDPFNIELDYGRNGLDITHQFKLAGVAELPYGITLSSTAIARSGLPYPAYIIDDINGDGVSNQGFGSNDRPVVTRGGERFLLERYPASQPNFFQLDVRLAKEFALQGRQSLEVLAEFFNLFNNDNLFSNPNISAFVNTNLTDIPKPGDVGPTGTRYRTLDQISPGSTPFAVQLGVRYNF